MAKPYEVYGIPAASTLEYDQPPEYATIYPVNDRPWDSSGLESWEIGLWGRVEYWTALEAALLITEICPNSPDIYAVTEEIVQDEGYGIRYYSWKHQFQWEIAESLLFLLERSPLAPKSAPVDWVRYYRDKCLNYFDSPFVGLRFGEKWFEFFCNELSAPILATNSQSSTPTAVSEKPLGSTERNTLLKQIAALSLVLAEKSGRYKRGSKPNALQIAEETGTILDALPDANSRGVGGSSIRESIKAGLELLTMTK